MEVPPVDFLQKKYPQIFDTFDVNTVYGLNNFGEKMGPLSLTPISMAFISYPKFVTVH